MFELGLSLFTLMYDSFVYGNTSMDRRELEDLKLLRDAEEGGKVRLGRYAGADVSGS